MSEANLQLLEAYLDGELPLQDRSTLEMRLKAEPALCNQLLALSRHETVLAEWARANAFHNNQQQGAAMHQQFDPYHQWLGINPINQPPHHYRLLGIELFESDETVIENAADQRMSHLRTFASGANSVLATKLLNEVAAAKVCLLRLESKSEYDAQLQSQMEPATPLPVAVSINESAPILPASSDGSATALRRRKQKSSNSLLWTTIGAGLAVAAVVLVAFFIMRENSTKEIAKPEQKKSSETLVATGSSSQTVTNPGSVTNSGGNEKQPDGSNKQPTQTLPGQSEKQPDDEKPPVVTVIPPVPEVPHNAETPVNSEPEPGEPIDLLANFDPAMHSVAGNWHLQDGVLISSVKAYHARCQLPGVPPREYDLLVRAKFSEGTTGLRMGLVCGSQQASLYMLDRYYRLASIDGKSGWDSPASAQHASLKMDQWYSIHCQVRTNWIRMFVDEKHVLEWKGDFDSLAFESGHQTKDAGTLSLGGYQLQINQLQVIPFGAEESSGPPPLDTPADIAKRLPVPDAAGQQQALQTVKEVFSAEYDAAKQPEELLALASKLHQQALETKDDPAAQFVLLRESYRLSLDAPSPVGVFTVVDVMAERFEIDDWNARSTAFNSLAAKIRLPEDRSELAEKGLTLASEAVAADRLDLAVKLASESSDIANRTRDGDLRSRAFALENQLEKQAAYWRAAQTAKATLAKNPEDPEANLALGQYLCFVARDWQLGFNHLAESSDEALVAVVRKDLEAKTAETMLAAADGWLEAAQGQKNGQDEPYRARAIHWYRECVDSLTGIEALRVTKQLERHDLQWQSAGLGLVGHWKFDDGEGTIAKDSVGTQHGKIGTHASWGHNGNRPVLQFDGRVFSYVEFPKASFGPTFSVAVWVKTIEPYNRLNVLIANSRTHNDGVEDGWVLYCNTWTSQKDRKLWFISANGKQGAEASTGDGALPKGEWAHVALVVDQKAGQGKIFVNGRPLQQNTEVAPGFGARPTWPWRFGGLLGDNLSGRFIGNAADLRVYNRALTEDEIGNIIKLGTQGK